jgi:hypothetical protein
MKLNRLIAPCLKTRGRRPGDWSRTDADASSRRSPKDVRQRLNFTVLQTWGIQIDELTFSDDARPDTAYDGYRQQ